MRFLITALLLSLPFSIANALDVAPVPASKTPLWGSQETLQVRLEANFKELLGKYRTLKPADGEQSSKADEAYVTGRLIYKADDGQDVALKLRLRARGNTSRHDCEFPKLSVEFTDPVKGTLFAKAKKIKLGTHCDDVNGRSGSFNRLRNQLQPHREAMAYRLLETLGVNSFKTRAALIDYVFTDEGDKHLLRNAFFLETDGDAEDRYQAKEIFKAEDPKSKGATAIFNNALEKTRPQEAILAYVGYVMVGSFDFIVPLCPKDKEVPLWNMKAFARADGQQLILPYDLDLAKIVSAPKDQIYLEFYLPLLRECFGAADVNAVKAHVLSKRAELVRVIDETDYSYLDIETGERRVDEEGREQAKAYLNEALKQIKAHL